MPAISGQDLNGIENRNRNRTDRRFYMTNTRDKLYMDLRIFEDNPRNKDKRKNEHIKLKKANLDELKDIMKKYFG